MTDKENAEVKTQHTWITSDDPSSPTDIFASDVAERQTRFVLGVWAAGDLNNTVRFQLHKKAEGGTYSALFPLTPVAPADLRQYPEGAYDVENTVLTSLEGGTNLAAHIDAVGNSISLAVNYRDYDV